MMRSSSKPLYTDRSESGNVIFFILLALALVGLVTAALRSGGLEGSGIERENTVIKVSQIRQYATELERGVRYALQNQISEVDLSFAGPDVPSDYGVYNTTPKGEIFNPQGGGANWRLPPSNVNDGSTWEFYATSAMPSVGSDEADLIAVLPYVSEDVCNAVNSINEQTATPDDPGICFYTNTTNRFDGTYSTSPNTLDSATFSRQPATQACVLCGTDRHFYHVLLAR